MSKFKTVVLAGLATLMASAGVANAAYLSGTFNVTVFTGNTGGNAFAVGPATSPFSAPQAAATFNYTGALYFEDSAAVNVGNAGDLNSTFFASSGSSAPNYGITNFTPILVPPIIGTAAPPSNANYSTLANFLASSGSAGNYAYGSFYIIDLGTLAQGTMLTITNNGGASIYQDGTKVGTTSADPTVEVTETVDLTSTADTTLYYSEQNGSPSILEVSISAPEPAGLWVLGIALLGLAAMRPGSKTAE